MSGVTLHFSALGDAWSGRGNDVLMLAERESLCALAYLPADLAKLRWESIDHENKVKLLLAFRRGVDLGLACARLLIFEADRQDAGEG